MIRLTVKRQIGKLWRSVNGNSRNGSAQLGIVVLYHAIGESPTSISGERFREHISWLSNNTQVADIDTIASGEWPDSPTGITSAITFDDGYVGVHQVALPILREASCVATVYVSTNTIDMHENRSSTQYEGLYPNERMLNWTQLRELSRNGISVGSHLMNHDNLAVIPHSSAKVQLRDSKSKIEDIVGEPCTSFAYPWGKYSPTAVEAVRDAGYRSAVIALHHTFARPSVDPLLIPRADIQKIYTVQDFQRIVHGDWDFLGYYQKLRGRGK